jgi:hypothetical protein
MASDTRLSDPVSKPGARWSGWFLAYLGLGLGLTATAVLVGQTALGLALVLYVFGAVCLAAGTGWRWLEPRLNPGFASSVAQIANDFRYWLLVLAVLVLFNWALPLMASGQSFRATAAAAKQLLSKPSLEWDGSGPISFTARFQRGGTNLRVYVDWGAAYGGGGSNDLLGGSGGFLPSPRVQIGAVGKFVTGQELDVVLAAISGGKGYDDLMLKWGDDTQDNPKVNVTWGSYMGKVVVVEQDSREEAYPFLVIARSRTNAEGKATALPPLLIGPSILGWIAK